MLDKEVAISYRDGHTETARITQYEVGQFDRWAVRAGLSRPGQVSVEAMPVLFMRFAAWCALHRGEKTRPDFDAWDQTVDNVEGVDDAPVDPTQTGTPDGPSPESP